VSRQIKYLNFPIQQRFAAKDFADVDRLAPNRSAVVQLLNGHLQPSQIILFIRHSVQ
jgi:hypothetical protein